MSDELTPPSRWPLWVAGAAAVVWLGITFAAMLPLLPGLSLPPATTEALIAAGVALNFAAPLAVIWLVAMRLRDGRRRQQELAELTAAKAEFASTRLSDTSEAIAAAEMRLSDLAGQLAAMARPVERQHAALVATLTELQAATTALTSAADRTEAATRTLGSETPAATAAAQALAARLEAAHALVTETGNASIALVADLAARLADARARSEELGAAGVARIAAIESATGAACSALAEPLALLSQGVDTALERTRSAIDETRAGVETQASALLASTGAARNTLLDIGGEAAATVDARLAALTRQLEAVEATLASHGKRATTLVEEMDARIRAFDETLASSSTTARELMSALESRLVATRESLEALAARLNSGDAALEALNARLQDLDGGAASLFGRIEDSVPAAHPGLDDLSARINRIHDEASAMTTPVTLATEIMDNAENRLVGATAALDAAAIALTARLESAESTITAITRTAEDDALNASTTLLDAFSRIREMAAQAAGTMRETLSGVVAEAEAALDQAGSSKAETAFGAPVRAAIAALEAQHQAAATAAQTAAERVTNRIIALTQTVQQVETHFDKRQTALDIRLRSDLAHRASKLIAGLHDQAIDLTRLLALDITDEDYQAWLAGDRSRFLRTLARSAEGENSRLISRHLAHDPVFATEATRFVEGFEALLGHVSDDPMGRALAATLLASDPGRLYMLLSGQQADQSA